MDYVVIGAGGFLGSYLLEELQAAGHRVLATARSVEGRTCGPQITWQRCDITKEREAGALIERLSGLPACRLFYLAAYHHPDLVQKHPGKAWETNITALSAFLNQAANVGALFYASTDVVYGEGTLERRFREQDPPRPVNLYGKHKALAEQLVLACGYNVVRFPFLIGPSRAAGKQHFYDTICGSLSRGIPIEMFADSYRSALSFRQAARLLVQVSELEGCPAVLNIASDDALSKYDTGRMIAEKHGYDPTLVRPIRFRDAQGIFEVPRAGTALLDNTLLKRMLGVPEIHLRLDEEGAVR